jgi:hypothetical protein
MLPAIAYTLMCFVVAAILTCGYALTRPIHMRDEMKSWRVLLGLFVFCFAGPYLYNETLTRWHGPELDHTINEAAGELPFTNLIYYKVTSYNDKAARVLAVFSERQAWGGMDHPQVALNLEKKGKNWTTTSYKVLNSERLNEETYVFPVYW